MGSLVEHLRQVLALDAAAPAIEFEGRWRSWGALAALADQLALRLDEAGLPEGAPVGLVLRNDPAMVAAVLAVLTTRRCVVTLSPHGGAQRLSRELETLGLPVIVGVPEDLAREAFQGRGRERSALITVDFEAGVACADLEAAQRVEVEPRPGVAIEMLTSGTTGPPKRVPLRFDSLEHSLVGAKHYEKDKGKGGGPRLRSGVAIISGPLVHVGGIWRVLQCLADGRAFVLLSRFAVETWRAAVVRHRPKTVSLVPAALRMVMDAEFEAADLSSVRAVISGTAPLAAEEAERFEAQYGVPVLTSYGATEFAGGVAGWSLGDHTSFRAAKRGSVGRAHPGCALRVVDEATGQVSAADEPGLLEVQSAQIGSGQDWIRTTDRARLDADGFLYLLGRADAAILRGGFKIQPDVVVAALEEHPAISEAAVVGLDHPRLGEVPVAALTLSSPDADVEEMAIRDFISERLAPYEVPERIRIVPALPRTPSMKVSQPGVRALFGQGASDQA